MLLWIGHTALALPFFEMLRPGRANAQAARQAKRIIFEGASRDVLDGPFPETRDLVAGFQIWQVKDMDEAVAALGNLSG